jgi:hypothetical protein
MSDRAQVLQYLEDKYSQYEEGLGIDDGFFIGYQMAMDDIEAYYKNLAVWEAS